MRKVRDWDLEFSEFKLQSRLYIYNRYDPKEYDIRISCLVMHFLRRNYPQKKNHRTHSESFLTHKTQSSRLQNLKKLFQIPMLCSFSQKYFKYLRLDTKSRRQTPKLQSLSLTIDAINIDIPSGTTLKIQPPSFICGSLNLI